MAAIQTVQSQSNNQTLKELLLKNDLQDIYPKLIDGGYDSLDLLSECTEQDILTICNSLKLTLIQKLKFKKCLRSVNIPKSNIYSIITLKEQKCLNEINEMLKKFQNIITDAHDDDKINKEMNENKLLINQTFDSIICIINKQKEDTLSKLNDAYNRKKELNQIIEDTYNELKDINQKSKSLLTPGNDLINIDFNARASNMINMKYEWYNKYKNINNINKVNVNIKNLNNIQTIIKQIIDIQPITGTVINQLNDDQDDNKDGSDLKPFIDDVIDLQNEDLLFDYNVIRAWRFAVKPSKWRSRGRGRLRILYNKDTCLAKLVFKDEGNDNRTRLLQYINGKTHCVFADDNDDNDEVEWNGADYTMDPLDPMISQWKLKFIDNSDKANEFRELFNKYIDLCNVDNDDINDDIGDKLFKFKFAPQSTVDNNDKNVIQSFVDNDKSSKWLFKQNDNDDNDNDNDATEITFKPLINLAEQIIDSGHSNDTLLETFDIIKLYRWGKDVSGEFGWKLRADKTILNFYQNKDTEKIRIVVRDGITSKLRLNQWISTSNVLNLTKKNDNYVYWVGFDATIQEEDDNNKSCAFLVKFKSGDISPHHITDKAIKMFNMASVQNIVFTDNNTQLQTEGKNNNKPSPKTSLIDSPFVFRDNNNDNNDNNNQQQPFSFSGLNEFDANNSDNTNNNNDNNAGFSWSFNARNDDNNDNNPDDNNVGWKFDVNDTRVLVPSGPDTAIFDFGKNIDDDPVPDSDDNCLNITFKPLIALSETVVNSGHDDDNLLSEYSILKLYRWGSDIAGIKNWKIRAENTMIQFYQNSKNGKIRIIVRDSITKILRLNQWIATTDALKLKKKDSKQISWCACDSSIDEQDTDFNSDQCYMFALKLEDPEITNKIFKNLQAYSANNTVIKNSKK